MQGGTIVTRQGDLLHAEIGGDMVALDIDSGSCFGFNATAKAIWEMLDAPRSIDGLCASLRERHEVDEDRCRREVGDLIDRLARERLVTLSPPS